MLVYTKALMLLTLRPPLWSVIGRAYALNDTSLRPRTQVVPACRRGAPDVAYSFSSRAPTQTNLRCGRTQNRSAHKGCEMRCARCILTQRVDTRKDVEGDETTYMLEGPRSTSHCVLDERRPDRRERASQTTGARYDRIFERRTCTHEPTR